MSGPEIVIAIATLILLVGCPLLIRSTNRATASDSYRTSQGRRLPVRPPRNPMHAHRAAHDLDKRRRTVGAAGATDTRR